MTNKIEVNVAKQQLTVFDDDKVVKTYTVSTGEAGIGQRDGSFKTPLGKHEIADKIGDGCALNAVFVEREASGEIYTDALAKANPERDWVLTRIMRLQGLEPGFNQGVDSTGHSVDTYSRCIYIHGTPDSEPMGVPRSHGCVRMRNDQVIELFDMLESGMAVQIVAD